jgi:hypothetical protein
VASEVARVGEIRTPSHLCHQQPTPLQQHPGRVDPAAHHELVRRDPRARFECAAEVVSAHQLGFPHEFLAGSTVRRFSTSGHFDRLDNHHPLGAATT